MRSDRQFSGLNMQNTPTPPRNVTIAARPVMHMARQIGMEMTLIHGFMFAP